jgi:putative PIN family toxin of toxin-antitoxin system
VKIVFDTNVPFAAFVASGLCSELYEAARDLDAIRISRFILAELEEKPSVKAGLTSPEINAVLAMVQRDSESVEASPLDQAVCRDPDDDWILATGLAAEADCITTGDKDLLVLESFCGIPAHWLSVDSVVIQFSDTTV